MCKRNTAAETSRGGAAVRASAVTPLGPCSQHASRQRKGERLRLRRRGAVDAHNRGGGICVRSSRRSSGTRLSTGTAYHWPPDPGAGSPGRDPEVAENHRLQL
eukprot:5697189-Pyramimonas_sp.AAC.1